MLFGIVPVHTSLNMPPPRSVTVGGAGMFRKVLPPVDRRTARSGEAGKVPLVTWMYVVTVTAPPTGITKAEVIGAVCVNVVWVVTVPGRNESQKKLIGTPLVTPEVTAVVVPGLVITFGAAKAVPVQR